MLFDNPVLPLVHSLVAQAKEGEIRLFDLVPSSTQDYPFVFIADVLEAPSDDKDGQSLDVVLGVYSDARGLVDACGLINKTLQAFRQAKDWTKIEEVRMSNEGFTLLTNENAGRMLRYLAQTINVQFKIKRNG